MAIRRTDIDIIIPSATYQQKNDIPVWDAYVVQDMGLGIEEKVISLTREGDRLKPNTPLKGLTSTMDLSS